MSEQKLSPWARPGSDDARPDRSDAVPVVALISVGATPVGPGTEPLIVSETARRGFGFGAGAVTGPTALPPAPQAAAGGFGRPPLDDAALRRRTMRWFAGGAAGILAIGIVVILAMALTGNSPLIGSRTSAPPDTRAPLAKLCPPPSGSADPTERTPPTPAGPRTVDTHSGISYEAFGGPWRTWNKNWNDAGDLQVSYRTGQYFVTETYSGGEYLATILSSSVPTATNDALTLDLKCTGHQVAADVRTAYYPQPNQMETIKDEQAVLGGRPAWVSEFRLRFHSAGLAARDELVAIALIDVGRPSAAILYVSIPGTHKQYDDVIDQLLDSVRPTS